MKLFIASDHGGYKLKSAICKWLLGLGFEVVDLGTDSKEPVDYPEYAKKLCEKVLKEGGRGILVCGTGIGMSIVANRFKGIRASLCSDEFSARMSREHNDANVLCLGGRVIGEELAKSIVNIWLNAKFSGEERHKRRIANIDR